jgi:hypothetical protein
VTRGAAVVLGLAFVVVGLVLVLQVPATNAYVRGEVGGHDGTPNLTDCSITVSYVVDGARHELESGRADRWCGFRQGDAVPVFYDAASPATGTLAPRDERLWWLVGCGVALLAGIALGARRQARAASLALG